MQCHFQIPVNCCNKLYYRYIVSFVPEMLSTNEGYDVEEMNQCYRMISVPPCEGNYCCIYKDALK